MSDTPDIPQGEDPLDPIDPTEPADTVPIDTNGNGHKNGKNGAHALEKPKNGNGNRKHAEDDSNENGKENGKVKNGNGNGKNGSLFSDKRFQVGILATLIIASLGVWWVIFQQASEDNGRDLPAPAGEFDPSLVTESTGEPAADSSADTTAQGPQPSVDPASSISEGATSDTKVATEAVIDDASGVTEDAELRERGFFDAIFKFRDPFQEPNPVTEPVSGSAE